jgi:palmitoyl transferase
MRRVLVLTLLAVASTRSTAARAASCDDWGFLGTGCRRVVSTYQEGRQGILLSGYAWHVPATWTPERRAELNENAWGGGLVRTTEDDEGDNRSVFILVFKDSHNRAQWNVGYEHSTYWGSRDGVQAGLGYTAMIVQRPDLAGGVPFPVVLPLAALRYYDGTLFGTYIPKVNGGVNHGSTLYVFGRVLLK